MAFAGADEDLGDVASLAGAAKRSGAGRVYVAVPPNHPERDRWSQQGVDAFLHRRTDVIEVVTDLFEALGIATEEGGGE